MLTATECQHLKCTKLVSNLRDESHYVTHYRCLQFYLDHGLVLTRIHRVVAFVQRPLMLSFVAYCNEQRKNAKSEFESNLYKLLANSFYGKTCENVRWRCNARLIADKKSSSEPSQKPTTSVRRSSTMTSQWWNVPKQKF